MKKIFAMMLICAALMGALFPGIKTEGSEADQRHLRISATVNADAGFTNIPLEQGNYKELTLLNLENVTIDLDGDVMKLEDALREGRVTAEQLVAWARLDASEGLCNEVAKSKNSLTEFTYRYPKFGYTLRSIYDLFEATNGRQYLIADVSIYAASTEPRYRLPVEDEDVIIYTTADEPHYLLPVEEQTGYPIDYEDWGLTFEISEVDRTGLTIACTQSGGQQLGRLEMVSYSLYAGEGTEPLKFDGIGKFDGQYLPQDGTEEFSIDWAGDYGTLPSGNYVFQLRVRDVYDKSQVHPLVEKFHDMQSYYVKFTVS